LPFDHLDRLTQARQLDLRASHTIGLSPALESYPMVVTA